MSVVLTSGINAERLQLGVAGLRSGRFKKGTSFLHRLAGDEPGPDDTYCCLGGLSVIARENGCPVESRICGETGYKQEAFGDQQGEFLSTEVALWYGFDSTNPSLLTVDGESVSATRWNDRGLVADSMPPAPEEDFGPIADAFERTYLNSTT